MTIVALPETTVVDAGVRSSSDKCFGLLCIYPLEASSGLIELTGSITRIGRSREADIPLEGEGIARDHATIESFDGEYWIRDSGSTHGTFVNGNPVTAQQLVPGDRIQLGHRIFRFLLADPLDSQYREAVYDMMTVDGLTGAHNRRYFEDVFSREILRSHRHWRPISLLLIDIDEFRGVNQQIGRLAGDECLGRFSQRLRSRIRGEDLFGRIGGAQFAVSLSEAPLKQSVRVAQDLRRLVEGEPFVTSQGAITLTTSIGVGFANGQEPMSAEMILKQANDNLRRAKAEGRNCVCY